MDENEISKIIIGSAIEVHKILGPGLFESAYEFSLEQELIVRKIFVERQKFFASSRRPLRLFYKVSI